MHLQRGRCGLPGPLELLDTEPQADGWQVVGAKGAAGPGMCGGARPRPQACVSPGTMLRWWLWAPRHRQAAMHAAGSSPVPANRMLQAIGIALAAG